MESEICKHCGLSGAHTPDCPTQFQAEAERSRAISDAEKVGSPDNTNVAPYEYTDFRPEVGKYVWDEGGKKTKIRIYRGAGRRSA